MHTASINSIATDAAGRWAVTASSDKTARVWDLANQGKLAQVLRPPQDVGKEGELYAARLSPDGETVAVGGWTGFHWEKSASIYIFDRGTGKLLRRLAGMPGAILNIAFSPDGNWLAASLQGTHGVRVFDLRSARQTGVDASYGGDSRSVEFSPDGLRLLTTSVDGELRMYTFKDGTLSLSQRVRPSDANFLNSAQFSPDGRLVAVGFAGGQPPLVLDTGTLTEVARIDTVRSGTLHAAEMSWTADGRYLVALALGFGPTLAVRWRVSDWKYESQERLDGGFLDSVQVAALPNGEMLYASSYPEWGVLDVNGGVRLRSTQAIASMRQTLSLFGLSPDARVVRFPDPTIAGKPTGRTFHLASRSLGEDIPFLARARTTDLEIERWQFQDSPTLQGKRLALGDREQSISLSIAADANSFVLGTSWGLRLFDRSGKQRWAQPGPSKAWAVNHSRDGRFIVAAFDDGTIRWHRSTDGAELLALMAHPDGKRWLLWTPQGFFSSSEPDNAAPDFDGAKLGYVVNQGREKESLFIGFDTLQLRERFLQPGLISGLLDAGGDLLLKRATAKLGDVRQLLVGLGKAAPPVLVIQDLKVNGKEVSVGVKVTDLGGGVGEITYYIDGQPQSGRASGVVGDATSPRSFTLPPGSRVISVAARNRVGVEGPRVERTVQIAGTRRRGNLHIFAVGVDLPPLRHSANDARVLASAFASHAAPLFEQVRTPRVLVNQDATLASIEKAFDEIRREFAPEDTLVIFLAGHGEASLKQGYTFLPWGYQRSVGPAGAKSTGLGEKQLRRMLALSPLQTLLLLDTCDAGGAIGMLEASHERLRGSKQVVIGASRRGEFAQEGFENHGVFTAALLRVMRTKVEHEDEREVRVPQLRVAVETEVRRIITKLGSASGQKVTGFLGSADFPLLSR